MLKSVANGRNIKLIEALNGQAAIDIVLNQKKPFDLIFMDLHMPVLNGFEVPHKHFYNK